MDGQESGQESGLGTVRAVGLVVASIAAMYGIVLLVNPGHYGVGGSVSGLVLALAGLAATVRFLRGQPVPESGAADGSHDEIRSDS
jgi:hypothetical protein